MGLGKLEKVNLRDIWANEAYDFSVWLSKDENLKELSNTIGIDIILEERESAVGKYSVDIYGKEEGTDRKVVIENQVLANFRTGGASNDKTIKKCLKRCKDRFQCYVSNGYSPLYLIECVGIELAKVILS